MRLVELAKLATEDSKIYLWMDSQKTAEKFLRDAEHEGFTFGDGEKPTARHTSDIFRVYTDNGNNHICYVGHVGRQAFQANKVIRVDYGKFAAGDINCIYTGKND